MKITLDAAAVEDLDRIHAWISKDNPRAADAMMQRLERKIRRLASPLLIYMGRPGLEPGTRELVEPPYVIVYEVLDDLSEIVVLAVFHGAQDREG